MSLFSIKWPLTFTKSVLRYAITLKVVFQAQGSHSNVCTRVLLPTSEINSMDPWATPRVCGCQSAGPRRGKRRYYIMCHISPFPWLFFFNLEKYKYTDYALQENLYASMCLLLSPKSLDSYHGYKYPEHVLWYFSHHSICSNQSEIAGLPDSVI